MDHLEELYTKFPLQISLAYNYLNQAPKLYKKGREQEASSEPLGSFRAEMWVNDMVNQLEKPISKGVEKWYKTTRNKFKKILTQNAIVYNAWIILNYAREWSVLQLSNFRWAISHTTKFEVIKVLKEGLDNNRTYNQVKDKIHKINQVIFGKPRARTIAVTEMGKWYEYWNVHPMRELQAVWVQVLKKRQTCNDGKVRPDHMECEELGRVPLEFIYPSVKVPYPPGWPNCRCTNQHRVID